MAKAGRVEEGLATIEKALTQSENSGDGYSLPELHRVKGQLMLRRDSIAEGGHINSPAVQARACFAEALAVARRQQARSWELRALISMDRVDSEGTQLHEELAACYSSFTEGFETADLKQARTQLTSVSLT
jgi:predicted ATPase